MRNSFKPSHWISSKGLNSFRSGRAVLLPFVAILLGVMVAGCSFLQPDLSTPETSETPAAAPETTARTVSLSETTDTKARTLAQNAREEAGAAQASADSESTLAASSQAAESAGSDGSSNSSSPTATSNESAPGPLSNILGDNVPQVSPPGEGGEDGQSNRPQLSGLSPTDIVAAQEQVLRGIYDSALPSVVLVKVSRNLGPLQERPNIPDIPGIPDDFFERTGGTGFVWDDQGHIVTNHHVVTQADRVTVVLPNRVEMEAEFLGSDPDSDLAVLKVSDPDGLLEPVTLGDSDEVYMGQLAVAMGNPFGQQFSITTGIISGIGRTIRSGHSPFSIPEVLQTDAPINPGNSGGPLLDRNGHVIGVNTQIISRTGVNSGIGFAVPINIAKEVVPSIVDSGRYQYSWLGISGTNLFPDIAEAMDLPRTTQGALVIEIVPEGPAAEAGLVGSDETYMLEGLELPIGGDVIVGIDGTTVETIDDVITFLVGKTRPEQEVTMDIIRDGEHQQIVVTLGTRPGS